jgi:hypothetical protein
MASSDWNLLAKNHIGGRDWGVLRQSWRLALNGFDATDISDISEAIEPIVGPGFENRDNVTVFEFPGRHVAAFNDGAAALLKCAYVLRAVGSCLLSGQPTWASVDAYHFSFLAGRALLALLGVHFVQVKDSHCVLDVFPEGLSNQERTKFRRANPSAGEPARLIFRTKSTVIEQRAVWSIFVRTIRMAKFAPQLKNDIDKICELGEGFGRARNDLLYRNASWLYQEDFLRPNRTVSINDDVHSYTNFEDFFSNERDANFAFAAILARILLALITNLQTQSGVALLQTSYAPCLTNFSGFSVEKLDALFATIYRREGYGANI